MDEEISRILRLLEEGKIQAAEAERLIRALKEVHETEVRIEPFGELNAFFRGIARSMRRAARAQRRCRWWQFFRYLEWLEQARRGRAETLSIAERVRFVLRERVMVEQESLTPEARLHDLLPDRMARDNLRYGLQAEFHLEIDPGDLDHLETVRALEEYISRRLSPPETHAASDSESTTSIETESSSPKGRKSKEEKG